MSSLRFSPITRGLVCCALVSFALATVIPKAQAAFHLWALREVYTNNSGSLQFIEMFDQFGGQQFVTNQQITVSNVGGTQQHTFTVPSEPADDSFNHALLFATAGVKAAGGPTPDYTLPDGFLFPGGGTINFFGLNSGPYSALPTDGNLSRTWTGGDAVNSPQNFAGEIGKITVASPDVLGDFNGDGHINSADIQPMIGALTDLPAYQAAHSLSNSALLGIGDLDKSNAVTNADLQGLLNKLKSGGGSGSFAAAAVPEPATLALIAAAVMCGAFYMPLRRRAA